MSLVIKVDNINKADIRPDIYQLAITNATIEIWTLSSFNFNKKEKTVSALNSENASIDIAHVLVFLLLHICSK